MGIFLAGCAAYFCVRSVVGEVFAALDFTLAILSGLYTLQFENLASQTIFFFASSSGLLLSLRRLYLRYLLYKRRKHS